MFLPHLLLMAALLIVMGKAARRISLAIHHIAKHLGWSDFLVAFGLLGLATSMPEISVAIFSATRGAPTLSLGNLLGANIVILSLLSGLAAILTKKVSPGSFYRQNTLPLFLFCIALPAIVVLDGSLTRLDGILLTAAYLAFMVHLYLRNGEMRRIPDLDDAAKRSFAEHALVTAAALAVLLTASYFLVNSALIVAKDIGAAPLIIGLMLFSLGTNIPEFTFVVTQSKGPNKNVVLGDLFGSILLNTPTLGLLAIISPFRIDGNGATAVSAFFLLALTVVFGVFMWTKRSLERAEGYMLLAFYAAFLVYYVRFL